jgi:hypothetical protein
MGESFQDFALEIERFSWVIIGRFARVDAQLPEKKSKILAAQQLTFGKKEKQI